MLCAAALGRRTKAAMKRHAEVTAGLAAACAVMRSEVSFLHTPPEEIFKALSKSPGPEGAFFAKLCENLKTGRTLSSAWEKTAAECSEELMLSAAEGEELLRLGTAIGRYDLDGTVLFISAAEEKFRAFTEQNEAKAEKDGKLHSTLWTVGGVAAALLLL